jgi:RecJ-like exonuclease
MEIRVREICPNCEGKGTFHQSGCEKCGSFFGTELDLKQPFLPCGHSRLEFLDEWPCLDCGGTGKIERWITAEEWLARLKNLETAVR